MIQSRTLHSPLEKRTGQSRPLRFDCVKTKTMFSQRECPHRLGAQDGALSRPKQGFESPWGHTLSDSHLIR